MTPGEAIRKHCVECVGSTQEVRFCRGDELLDGTKCWFFKNRLKEGRPSVKLIRKFCLHCMGGSSDTVKDCPSAGCLLYPFRFGKNPNIEFIMTEGRKKALQTLKKFNQKAGLKRDL
jgi:hypothetical protein